MSDVEQLTERLAELTGERNTVAGTRTREDVRGLAESWLGAACARANGTAAGFVLNQHAGPAEVQAVLAEFLLDSPALLDFLVARVEQTASLSDRQKKQQLGKLDEAMAAATAELLAARRAAAIAEVEAQFATTSGEAA